MLHSTSERIEWSPRVARQQVEWRTGDDRHQLIHERDVPVIGQFTEWERDADDIMFLRRLLRFGVKYQTSGAQPRLSGIKAANEYFGTIPPKPTRRRMACRYARIYETIPELRPLMERITRRVLVPFREHFPEQYAEHTRLVTAAIHSDWLIAGEPFTSGIINNTAALPYHKDSGNLAGTWSIMLCLRDKVEGGHLHIPEYETTLGIPDQSLTIFNGQEAWHGVTPFRFKQRDAYRFTIVWYVKADIAKCLCARDEWRRAAEHATAIHDEYADTKP
jgi:hypothetical protein